MRLMVFGTYDTTVHPRVGILAEGLQRQGVDVVECNVPLGAEVTAPERVPAALRPHGVPAGARHARALAELAVRARRGPRPDIVLCGHRARLDLHVARRLFPGTPLVLDHLVDPATGTDRARDRLRTRVGHAALRAADVILTDTEEHRRLLPGSERGRAVVVPIGASPVWFDAGRGGPPGPPGAAGGPLRVIVFGWFSSVQGAPVIGAALRQLDGFPVEVTVVGRGPQLQRTRDLAGRNPLVRWRSWVPRGELPTLAAEHDLCLGVFGTGPDALRVVPNKVFQGAAAGCGIVTSDTAPQRRALPRGALFVPPGQPDALADTLRRLTAAPGEVARLRVEAAALARERFAPQAVVEPLVERLELLAGKGRVATA